MYDKVFNSFEKDLFSQKFVEDPPYYSKQVDVQYASIKFNNIISFNSEGRAETIILIDEDKKPLSDFLLEKKVKVFLNYTVFKNKDRAKSVNNNYVVWELVISPIDPFNEYEFIQIEKYFTGKQESFINDIKYIINMQACVDLFDFSEKLIGNNVSLRREVLAGTIQIDTSGLTYIKDSKAFTPLLTEEQNWTWSQIYQYYNSDSGAKKNKEGADKLELIYSNYEDAKYILNTFCGIALGIFDFDRMSIEEVDDTLVPLRKTDSYFVILNKNSIVCFCDTNDIYANALKYGIGINPYLIIPNAVLAYNSFLTLKVYEKTARLGAMNLNHSDAPPSWYKQWARKLKRSLVGDSLTDKPNRLSELMEQKDHISSFLKNVIPNVYQYETERELYNYGMEKRGIVEKREDLEEYKKEVEEEISHLVNERANLLGKLSLILGIISLSQIYQFFDILKNLFSSPDAGLSKYISLFFTFVLLIFFLYFSLKNYRIILVDSRKDRLPTDRS